MAKIQVRNFPDDLYTRLEEMAAMSERSIEGHDLPPRLDTTLS
ncbi:FitA-like ribbon-helix-helix domain-containing protein [Enterobacter ludwigii]